MTKQEMTATILAAKKKAGVSFAALAERVGGHELWLASCCDGENSLPEPFASKLCAALSLPEEVKAALVEFPIKGQSLGQAVPTDPLIYRFYEIMQVYGMSLKDVILEKFWRRHHERDRFHDGHPERGGSKRRPRGRDNERQVLAIREVVTGAGGGRRAASRGGLQSGALGG